MIMTYFLTLQDVEDLLNQYAEQYAYDEPLEPFESANKEKLESVLHAPQREFYDNMLYSTLESQAAVLFYEMIKMHPFVNGNKRMACICLFSFLSENGCWLYLSDAELYETAKETANTSTEDMEEEVKRLASSIKSKMSTLISQAQK